MTAGDGRAMRRQAKGEAVKRELLPGESKRLLQELHLLTREGNLNADALRKLKQVNHLVRLLQPAVEDVEQLVAQVRASGLRVSYVRLGTPRHLPPGAGLTVYRIAQEALTNVLKHAGPDPSVTVMLQWQPAAVTLEVSDDGRGAAADADGLGQGLLGMRERATMFGGTVTAGPRPGGGFRVRATLPTPGTGPSPTADPATGAEASAPAPVHDTGGPHP